MRHIPVGLAFNALYTSAGLSLAIAVATAIPVENAGGVLGHLVFGLFVFCISFAFSAVYALAVLIVVSPLVVVGTRVLRGIALPIQAIACFFGGAAIPLLLMAVTVALSATWSTNYGVPVEPSSLASPIYAILTAAVVWIAGAGSTLAFFTSVLIRRRKRASQ